MQEFESHSEASLGAGSPHSRLNSWKEIACYLDRGVRTLQRWEQKSHLPIHRIGRSRRSPVYALVSELNFWLATSGRVRAGNLNKTRTPAPQNCDRHHVLALRLHDLAERVARNSARHQRQAEALEKQINALRLKAASRRADSETPASRGSQ